MKITRCDLLRIERHELLEALTEQDAYMRERRFLRGLIHGRLKEISEAMMRFDCSREPDEGQYMDMEREWAEELQRLTGETDESAV